jgi:hypothetical protein
MDPLAALRTILSNAGVTAEETDQLFQIMHEQRVTSEQRINDVSSMHAPGTMVSVLTIIVVVA